MTYRAQAFHSSLPNGQSNGTVRIDAMGIHFTSTDLAHQCTLPLAGLEMKLAGMNSNVPEWRHASTPGWVILCNDPSALDEPLLKQSGTCKKQVKLARRTITWAGFAKACVVLSVPVVLLLGALWWYRDDISASIVRQIPVHVEKQLGEAFWQQVKASETIIDNAEYSGQIKNVTNQLLPHVSKLEGMEFHFHVAQNDELINAYAMPGGHVIVYTGLLKKVTRPDQLAGVLAHEIAHVTERHSLNNMVTSMGLSALVSLFIGDAGTLATIVGESSESLIGQKFSRDAEREADDVAWETMVRAKFDPAGLREFFEFLKAEEDRLLGSMSGRFGWLSTHPDTIERIERLREKEQSLKK